MRPSSAKSSSDEHLGGPATMAFRPLGGQGLDTGSIPVPRSKILFFY